MVFAFWGPKGGVGTSTVAAACAIGLARNSSQSVLLVDAAGDLPALLGLVETSGPGVTDWLSSTADLPADALGRLGVSVSSHLDLLPLGSGSEVQKARVDLLAALFNLDDREVVIDCGVLDHQSWPSRLAAVAQRSIMVVNPCYLAIQKARLAPLRPQRVVFISQSGRALQAADVEHAIGVEVAATVPHDLAVARCIDAGLMVSRFPRPLKDLWRMVR